MLVVMYLFLLVVSGSDFGQESWRSHRQPFQWQYHPHHCANRSASTLPHLMVLSWSNLIYFILNADENGCCPRTVKYLQGLAAGKWIVGYNCECTK